MDLSLVATIVTIVAMLTSALVFPFALKYARTHNIVDQPNARKLQRSPVPVFGGVVCPGIAACAVEIADGRNACNQI